MIFKRNQFEKDWWHYFYSVKWHNTCFDRFVNWQPRWFLSFIAMGNERVNSLVKTIKIFEDLSWIWVLIVKVFMLWKVIQFSCATIFLKFNNDKLIALQLLNYKPPLNNQPTKHSECVLYSSSRSANYILFCVIVLNDHVNFHFTN